MKHLKVIVLVLLLVVFIFVSVVPTEVVYAQFRNGSAAKASLFNTTQYGLKASSEKVRSQSILPPKNADDVVYLTFDDGPDPYWTLQILDILERYQARATFYMIGYSIVSHPQVVREVARRSQTISVHGFNHADLSTASYTYFYNEVHDTEAAVLEALQEDQELIQQFGRCVRPPYGKKSDLLYSNAEAMGYDVSMWNIDTKDWSGLSPEEIFAHFKSVLEPQKVILMHDGGADRANTIKALELILHELLMQGYTVLPYCTQYGQAIKTNN